MVKTKKIDAVTLEILNNAFMSIAEEMGGILIRSVYSSNIKERKDCSSALFSADGTVIAQAEHIPVHLGSLLGIIPKIRERFPEDQIEPGDIFVANDPYNGGGTHLPDITLCMPVFHEGKIIAFAANIAHHSDVGGRVPGSCSGDSTSIFQEGLRLPPIKICKKGVLLQEVMDVITLNCRTGFERMGDILAQIAANLIAQNRMSELVERYGLHTILDGMEELINYGERKMRAGIRALPNGEAYFEDWMDDDGVEIGKPFKLCCKICIEDERIKLDFSGSSEQVRGAVNVVTGALRACVYYAVKSIVDPKLPANGGFFRPIEIYAPEGSVLNPTPPSACGGRTDTCQRVADVIFGAMSKVVPKAVMAGCASVVQAATFCGKDQRNNRDFVYVEAIAGGYGARHNKDGMDGVQCHVTNSSNLPIECLEMEYPMRVSAYEIRKDSGGAGKYRGGLGVTRSYEMLIDTEFSSHADRQKFPPWGIAGGLPGECGSFVVNPGTADEWVMPSGKMSGVHLKPGDILSANTPGSGGYGNPFERDSALVLDDIINEKVSVEKAAELYGVAIDPATMTVNQEKTQILRSIPATHESDV